MSETTIQKVLFIGSKELGFKCLNLIHSLSPNLLVGVLTIDDSNDKRSVLTKYKTFCNKREIPFFIASNKAHSEEIILHLNPEIGFVVCWYWLISEKVISKIPNGLIGIHNSLLPKYRGRSPLVWSIINNEEEVGISLFSFSNGMDNGDIWGQKKIYLKENHYVGDVLTMLEDEAISLLKELYQKILEKKIKPKPQDLKESTFCTLRLPEDGEIDWTKSSKEVYNFIRAQASPYPGAFTWLQNEKLYITKAKPINEIHYGTPGQVAWLSDEGAYVICGDNKPLIIEKVFFRDQTFDSSQILNSIKIRLKRLYL